MPKGVEVKDNFVELNTKRAPTRYILAAFDWSYTEEKRAQG